MQCSAKMGWICCVNSMVVSAFAVIELSDAKRIATIHDDLTDG